MTPHAKMVPTPFMIETVDAMCAAEIVPPRDSSEREAGERTLCAAILVGALIDAVRGRVLTGADARDHPSIRQSESRKAQAYIYSNDRAWPFSFVNLCEILHLNVGKVRAWLETATPDSLPHFHIVQGPRASKVQSTERRKKNATNHE